MSRLAPEGSTGSGVATRPSLIDRLRSADPTGWERLVELYRPLVWHWARTWGVRPPDCEDVGQDVFRVVVERITSFRLGDRHGSFRAWLREITRNVCRERRRSNGPVERASGGTDAVIWLNAVAEHTAEDDDPPELKADLYRRALALVRETVSERDWVVFQRHVLDEQPSAQVAAELALTVENVRTIKSRILRRLREELGDVGGFDPPPARG